MKKNSGAEIITLYRAEYDAMKATIMRLKMEIQALEFRVKSLMSGAGKK